MSDDTRPTKKPDPLSAEQAAELEQVLLNNPDDVEIRTRLLIHYMMEAFRSREAHKAHVRHILWVIEHAPETDLAGSPFVVLQPGSYDEAIRDAKSLWLQQVANHPESAAVLGNAAKFLFYASPQDWSQAWDWLQTAAILDPTNAEWPEQLGRLAQFLDGNEKTIAEQALRHFERAYELTENEERRVLLLDDLARNAYAAEEFAKAEEYAMKLLQGASLCRGTWNYGNALHWSHILLGKIALWQGDNATARLHLKVAGETPGSPQLNAFGPDISLAKELLEHQEKEAVVAYFAACSKFWVMGKERLTAWDAALRQDQLPDFSVSCRI